jgi:hypothetical protein
VPEDFVKIISKVDDIKDIESIFSVASKAKVVSKVARVLKTVPFLDAIALGMDVMTYMDESNEAELIKKTNKLR